MDNIELSVPAELVANRLQTRLAELVADYEMKIAIRDTKIVELTREIALLKSQLSQQEAPQE